MGCAPSSETYRGSSDPTRLFGVEAKLSDTTKHPPKGPVRVASRAVDVSAVLNQRRRASLLVEQQPRARRRTTCALEPKEPIGACQQRMSAIGAASRLKLLSTVRAHARKRSPSKRPPSGLEARLRDLGLGSHIMDGDGNCQFRSLAFNFFGSQRHHLFVRQAAVEHMRLHADFFGMFFDGQPELDRYLEGMSRPRTWGDELTLRASVEAYGCVAHLVTSEPANWYLVYQADVDPVDASASNAAAASAAVQPTPPPGLRNPPRSKDVFLSYVSPIHYNAVVCRK
ncbi:hypothetical protein M885DRAFT_552551 [Pelagophyceae sp. CCMP2097]|nr:hypothetical protein M885DRAFT_552552 [Pelagophyceae sp. CCMP2097]KAJ1444596.1 hypothetical protein M885DRAFT_552551 [Pelagophyceae sp. CCMP2097]